MTDDSELLVHQKPSWRWISALCAIVVVGAMIRFYGMTTQSLWFDELWSVHFSRPELPLAGIIAKYAGDFHPLLYPLLLHWWMNLFGCTDIAARSLSIIAGIAGIPAMAWLGYRIDGPRLSLAAAAIVAVNPFHLAYSQEVRSYSLVFVFAALSFAALSALIDRPSAKWAFVYVVTTALAFHTHYFALLMACGQLAAAISVEFVTTRRKKAIVWLLVSGGGMAAVLLPWLGPVLRAAGVTRYWPAKPRPAFVFEYLHDYFGHGIALTGFVIILLVALPFLLRNNDREATGTRQRRFAAVMALTCALLLLVTYLRSVFIVPMLIARFTMVLLPAVFVLVCISMIRLPRRFAALALVMVIGGSAFQVWHTGFPDKPLKEQWREAIYAALDDRENQHQHNVFVSPFAPGFQFYASMRSDEIVIEYATVEILENVCQTHQHDNGGIWLLVARGRQPKPEAMEFLKRNYRIKARHRFHTTSARYWVPKAPVPSPPGN